ncbi:MAG: MotA/TolQ/ExbB proton channel family protein [Acidobacteriota bacterium]
MFPQGDLLVMMQEGGWVLWALGAFSVVCLAVALERVWVLRRERTPMARLVQALRGTLGSVSRPAVALTAVERVGGASARVVLAGLERYSLTSEEIEAVMERRARKELRRLTRGLGLLSSTAVTAPLLGFLGTVTGMIASFGALGDYGTSNPSLVAQGIEEALLTTAAGLAVAVPVHLVHGLLASRVDRMAHEMEDLGHLLLDLRRMPNS